MSRPTVIITGAAKRLGKAIALAFANRGCDLVIHYNQSDCQAQSLEQQLSQIAPKNSYLLFKGDLSIPDTLTKLIETTISRFGRIDHLINNASIFYPTPVDECISNDISHFLQINYDVPTRLAKLASPFIKTNQGSIVNLVDIYADAGLKNHTAYVAAKSALKAATQTQALEFAPSMRVNGVSPGAILWPDEETVPCDEKKQSQLINQDAHQRAILDKSALKRLGQPVNIAATVCFLALDATYTTGSVIRVDGGRRDYI